MGWHLHQFFYHLKQTAPLFVLQKEGSKDLVNLKTCLVTKHPQGVWFVDARRARELRNYSVVTGRFPFWTSDCPRNVAADVKWLPVVIGDHFLHSRLLARCFLSTSIDHLILTSCCPSPNRKIDVEASTFDFDWLKNLFIFISSRCKFAITYSTTDDDLEWWWPRPFWSTLWLAPLYISPPSAHTWVADVILNVSGNTFFIS